MQQAGGQAVRHRPGMLDRLERDRHRGGLGGADPDRQPPVPIALREQHEVLRLRHVVGPAQPGHGDLYQLRRVAIAARTRPARSAISASSAGPGESAARSPAGSPTLSGRRDRKSTRLNSSHSQISYAVFCLKKKKNKTTSTYYKKIKTYNKTK